MAQAFEPELLFEAQEIHSYREPHFIVEQIGSQVAIGYLLSYYYDGGFVSHNGDSEMIIVWIRPWGTRWHLERITTTAHLGASWGADRTDTRDWNHYYFVSSLRARIYVSRNHHANYESTSSCNAWFGDVCSAAPSDGGFAQVAGRGYEGESGINLWNNIGNVRRRLPIDPFFSFGSTPSQYTDCTSARMPGRPGVECYLGGLPKFQGWVGIGGTTPYFDVLNAFGFHNGFSW